MGDSAAGGIPGSTGASGAGGTTRLELAWELRGAEAAVLAAEARLRGIRAVLAAVEPEAQALPPDVDGWRSPAAIAYAEQLLGLRREFAGAVAALHAAEASAWRELAGWQGECERLGRLLRQAAELAGG
ncbi:hypothetical protein [Microterricola pindariensis]|uniref:Uncharacterized protein n=1 Tax=Microterricola pindariensis TaxID=478010 RepID=A0ABX5ATR1_9MICO|nr:hypothetical protein [Microterricola pindariensis]PPL17205.1 hypothetical protein GY24_11780 [Microterricola pindariensis]